MFGLAKGRDISDEEMMKNFQHGDNSAFNELLDRYGSKILFFIMKKLNMSKPLAEDLLQEIFIKVIEKGNSFDTSKKFSTWLYTITNNRCIDYMRVEGNKITSSLDEELCSYQKGPTRLELVKSRERNPEDNSYNKEVKTYIEKAVSELKEELKEVFLLREIERLSLNEISIITGAPLNTVKTRLRTAYINLRQYLIANGCFSENQKIESVK